MIMNIIMMKKDIMSMGYASSYSEKVVLGSGALIAKCIAEGDKQERAEGINYHSLQHSGGIIIVYTNTTDGQTLNEKLSFTLEGMVVKGHEGSDVDVKCGPGETIDVQLETTGGGYSYGVGMSYSISS